ncbi:hypothetical protein MKW98_003714 [Papaver atlanticum]|uniref:Uncharacterized protein n=1 Tax=Papaver atlanticum TaxID=357466 RepID=A0AAD4SHX5_9MAGN|nr:hypothetical protein MKW98_003714 [Papaver atlanticum]
MEDADICTHQNDYVNVWTMTDNIWSRHSDITADGSDMFYGGPIQTLQNGEILFEGGPRVEEGSSLLSYDPSLETTRTLKIHDFPYESIVETYIETLVALNSGTYVRQ